MTWPGWLTAWPGCLVAVLASLWMGGGRLASSRQGFLLHFPTRAMIWPSPGQLSLTFPYQNHYLTRPGQENVEKSKEYLIYFIYFIYFI